MYFNGAFKQVDSKDGESKMKALFLGNPYNFIVQPTGKKNVPQLNSV